MSWNDDTYSWEPDAAASIDSSGSGSGTDWAGSILSAFQVGAKAYTTVAVADINANSRYPFYSRGMNGQMYYEGQRAGQGVNPLMLLLIVGAVVMLANK